MFAHRALPAINQVGLFFILGGVFVTIMVCAIMPSRTGAGYATTASVWKQWENQTGYSSNGFVFVAGMLNGAYSVGTPDCIAHLAEEIPNPKRNIPKAIAAQMLTGLLSGFLYLIAMFYAINSMDDLLSNTYASPLAEMYLQATGSRVGSLCLLILIFLPSFICLIGNYIVASRALWTLARDNATPFPGFLGRISRRHNNPFNATFVCGIILTALACISLGSTTAFNAFVGSFVVLSSLSYLAAILPNILTRRSHVKPGPFWMPSLVFNIVGGIGCTYILVFMVIFCFPYSMPVTAANMNYASLIMGGFTIFVALWYMWKRGHGYVGPKVLHLGSNVSMVEDREFAGEVVSGKGNSSIRGLL